MKDGKDHGSWSEITFSSLEREPKVEETNMFNLNSLLKKMLKAKDKFFSHFHHNVIYEQICAYRKSTHLSKWKVGSLGLHIHEPSHPHHYEDVKIPGSGKSIPYICFITISVLVIALHIRHSGNAWILHWMILWWSPSVASYLLAIFMQL